MRLKDRTDWWSINNESFRRADVKARSENVASGTFEIAGVSLGSDQVRKLAIRFGKAPIVERGDASAARQQVCYVTGEDSGSMYLIFEFGEDENVFYLFSGGAAWNGRGHCVRTTQLSRSSETASGLRLGLTPAEVEATLGKADAASDGRLVYSREIQQKTTPAQFEKLREDYPGVLSDRAAHEKFDSYSMDVYIEVRFGESGLNYLTVSKSGEAH